VEEVTPRRTRDIVKLWNRQGKTQGQERYLEHRKLENYILVYVYIFGIMNNASSIDHERKDEKK